MTDATCTNVRELISAAIDGELTPSEELSHDTHLQSCRPCRDYQQDVFALRRTLRISAVQSTPDTPDQTVSASASSPVSVVGSLRGVTFLRWALFVIGGTLVAINAQSVVWAESGTAAHLSRHDGVFGTALGIGMLAVALKPQRAIGLVPLTASLAVLMLVVAGADLVAGNANLLSEAIHIVQFAGLLCLWVISGGPSRLPHHLETITTSLRPRSAGSVPGWPTAS